MRAKHKHCLSLGAQLNLARSPVLRSSEAKRGAGLPAPAAQMRECLPAAPNGPRSGCGLGVRARLFSAPPPPPPPPARVCRAARSTRCRCGRSRPGPGGVATCVLAASQPHLLRARPGALLRSAFQGLDCASALACADSHFTLIAPRQRL